MLQLKMLSAILIHYTSCQIQRIAPHSPLSVHSVCANCHSFHCTDTTASGSVIKKEPLEKVAAGGNFKVKNQDDKKIPLPVDTILSQANARVGEKVDYGPLTYNCETVASEMRYGKGQGHSEQVLLKVSTHF